MNLCSGLLVGFVCVHAAACSATAWRGESKQAWAGDVSALGRARALGASESQHASEDSSPSLSDLDDSPDGGAASGYLAPAMLDLALEPQDNTVVVSDGGSHSRLSHGFAVIARYTAFADLEAQSEMGLSSTIGDIVSDTKGVGVELNFLDDDFDVIAGYDSREYEGLESREVYAGFRRKLKQGSSGSPYIAGKIRYGRGIEFPATTTPAFDSDDFWAWGAGFGVLGYVSDNVFVDLNLFYEDVFGDIDAHGFDLDITGWVGTVGLGVTL